MADTTVGIIGAGQMGSGIAHVFALSGYRVLLNDVCLLYTSPSPRDGLLSRMPSSA